MSEVSVWAIFCQVDALQVDYVGQFFKCRTVNFQNRAVFYPARNFQQVLMHFPFGDCVPKEVVQAGNGKRQRKCNDVVPCQKCCSLHVFFEAVMALHLDQNKTATVQRRRFETTFTEYDASTVHVYTYHGNTETKDDCFWSANWPKWDRWRRIVFASCGTYQEIIAEYEVHPRFGI